MIGSFVSPDTGALNTVYLSEYGIDLETADPISGTEVHPTDPMEIWRYLYHPLNIIENLVSSLIAVTERHMSIKDDWLLSIQKVRDLCLRAGKCKTET